MLVVNDILNDNFNQSVIERLIGEGFWKIALDQNYEKDNLLPDHSDSGMLFMSYAQNQPPQNFERFSFFNNSAEIIFNSVLLSIDKKFENIQLKRVLWNYYNKGSTGVYHNDHSDSSWYSIVYNLNTSDGGTVIDSTFVDGLSGRAILFKSNLPHKGVGPNKSKHRFAVNIIFTAEELV